MTATIVQRSSSRAYGLTLLLIIVFIAAAAIRVWAIANTDPLDIGTKPFVDDSFYYFSLGRNLADSLQARVDSFHLTNGFQPLWGFLVAIPYLIFPDPTAIMVIQGMGAAFSLGAGAIIYLFTVEVTRSRLAGIVNAAAWLLMPYAIREGINGMETALAVFGLLLAAWLFYRFYTEPTRRHLIAAALASGFAIMTRVDLALFTAAVLLFLLVFPPVGHKSLTDRLRLVITFGVLALIPCLPWVIFSLAIGKAPLPESGAAVRELAIHYVDVAIGRSPADVLVQQSVFRNSVAVWLNSIRNFVLWVAPFRRGVFADFYVWLVALGVVGLIAFIRRQPAWQVLTAALLTLGMMTAAYLFFIPVYWYYERYLHPLVALLSTTLGIVIAYWVMRLWAARSARFRVVGILVALVYGAALLYFGVFLTYRSATMAIIEHRSRLEYDTAAWINDNLAGDENALIGSYQSGIIGYYLTIPHMNLDGVVNSDAYHAIATNTGWSYVCSQGITHVVERPDVLAGILSADQQAAPTTSADPIVQLAQFGTVAYRQQIADDVAFNTDYVVLELDRSKCPTGTITP